jgi:hypothetical protein
VTTHFEQPTTDDRDSIRQVQGQRTHTEDGLRGDSARPVETAHEDGDADHKPDRPDGSFGVPVDPPKETTVGKTTISAERVERSSVGLQGGLDGKEALFEQDSRKLSGDRQ